MRAFVYASAISLVVGPGAATAAPRVASLNLCTDELLLALAPRAGIVSVTHLSHIPLETSYWRRARRFSSNDGTLLSAVRFRPNLVVTMGGGARDTGRLARRLGIRVLAFPYPQSLSDVRRAITVLAAAIHRPDAGAALNMMIGDLQRTAPSSPKEAVWLGGGGRSLAADGLGAEWMALAGLRQRALAGDRISLEQLLMRPPAILVRSDYRSGQYSEEQRWLTHPLARGSRVSRTLATDGRRWTCMGPAMIAEVLRLRKLANR